MQWTVLLHDVLQQKYVVQHSTARDNSTQLNTYDYNQLFW